MSSNAEQQADYRRRVKSGGGVGAPGRPPKPIAHGTRAGAAQHRRRGERPCPECLAADAASAADRRRSASLK